MDLLDITGKDFMSRNENDHNDYFPTYHSLIKVYLDTVIFPKKDLFMEPAAGAGDITKILNEYGYKNIIQSDIFPRNKEIIKLDFIKGIFNKKVDHVITNPPFKLSIEFMKKSSEVCKKTISFLWPIDYLSGKDRYNKIYKEGINDFYLDTIHIFSRKPLFDKKYSASGKMPSGAKSFAWFLFKRRKKFLWFKRKIKEPRIIHIDINKYMGKPRLREQLEFELN